MGFNHYCWCYSDNQHMDSCVLENKVIEGKGNQLYLPKENGKAAEASLWKFPDRTRFGSFPSGVPNYKNNNSCGVSMSTLMNYNLAKSPFYPSGNRKNEEFIKKWTPEELASGSQIDQNLTDQKNLYPPQISGQDYQKKTAKYLSNMLDAFGSTDALPMLLEKIENRPKDANGNKVPIKKRSRKYMTNAQRRKAKFNFMTTGSTIQPGTQSFFFDITQQPKNEGVEVDQE